MDWIDHISDSKDNVSLSKTTFIFCFTSIYDKAHRGYLRGKKMALGWIIHPMLFVIYNKLINR